MILQLGTTHYNKVCIFFQPNTTTPTRKKTYNHDNMLYSVILVIISSLVSGFCLTSCYPYVLHCLIIEAVRQHTWKRQRLIEEFIVERCTSIPICYYLMPSIGLLPFWYIMKVFPSSICCKLLGVFTRVVDICEILKKNPCD